MFMSIGNLIRQLRKDRNVTMAVLSEMTGLSQPFLSQVENNKRRCSPDTLKKIAEALNVPYTDLLAASEDITFENRDNQLKEPISFAHPYVHNQRSGIAYGSYKYEFPINDIHYHLMTDKNNLKLHKGIVLSMEDRKTIEKLIDSYLLQKYAPRLQEKSELLDFISKLTKPQDESLEQLNEEILDDDEFKNYIGQYW